MQKFLPAALLTFFLTACGAGQAAAPAETATPDTAPAAPTAAPTIEPTVEPAAEPTTEPTPVPIPEFMNAFLEAGYDQQSQDGPTILAVLDKASTVYSSEDWGKPYGKSVLFSWSTVYLVEDGELQSYLMLNDFCSEFFTLNSSDVYYGCYVTASDNLNTDNVPPGSLHSTAWTRGTVEFVHGLSESDHPIVLLEFNAEYFNARNDYSALTEDSFFQHIYPPHTGTFTTFEIPGIGTFLPVTHVDMNPPE